MSTRTPNINLEKPSSDENYSISVFNGNSDTIDTEMALRVKTADIVNNLTSTATNKPLSAAQGKKLQDEKVAISSIVNNLTSTATNAPLSAAQGKALSDTKANISDIKNNLTSTDTNKPLSANMGKSLADTIAYFRNMNDNGRLKAFSGDTSTLHSQGNSIYWCDGNATSLPSGETYGVIATFICSGALWYGSQIFMSTSGNYYTREINGGIWGTWDKLTKEGTAIAFTPTMPDGNTSIHRTCHYAVQGNHVHVDFAIKINNAQSGFSNRKICQTGIPSQYLPPVDIDVICSNGEATGYTLANLTYDGKLIIYPQKSGTTYGIGWFEYFI